MNSPNQVGASPCKELMSKLKLKEKNWKLKILYFWSVTHRKKADGVLPSPCQAGGVDTQLYECNNLRTNRHSIC